jgi:hypothetical protein
MCRRKGRAGHGEPGVAAGGRGMASPTTGGATTSTSPSRSRPRRRCASTRAGTAGAGARAAGGQGAAGPRRDEEHLPGSRLPRAAHPAGHGDRHRPHPPAGRVSLAPEDAADLVDRLVATPPPAPRCGSSSPAAARGSCSPSRTPASASPGAAGHPVRAFRQGPGASPHAPGVGIGLSLVARFAELHGGRAWVQDRPGGGASFQVLLPDPGDGDGDRN